MKQGWEIKTLGQLADVKGGKRVPKGYRLETKPTDYPYIRVTDFNDSGSVDLNDLHYINKDVYEQIRNYTITTSDLYISIAGTIGKTGIIPEELDGANLTENACKLVFKVDVNPKLVYYFTKTESFLKQAGLNTRVAAMPKLALTRLSTISLLFPKSLPEQQRIVAILDEAFAAIAKAKANAEQNLRNAKELFESYLQSIFTKRGEGWMETTLGNVCQFENGDRGKNYPNREEYVALGIPWINTGHIQSDGTLSESEMNFISRKKFESLRSGKIRQGDLVYCLRGATLGKTALVDPFTEGAVASSLVIIRPNDLLDRHFLYYFLSSPLGQGLIKLYANGAAQPNLGAKSVAKYKISLPKLVEQKVIVQKLDALSAETKKLESIYQQKINDLDELKKSILQKAFSGELKASKEVAA